ncbi:L,D-transpeptidase [Pseudomonas sp. GX19020]|uniref:L,D-transpeptidase n=1 Tax=Pseudomonas sp. GX19020 TaxID=2942277 RepID=UPI0020195E84|nr:L,D-transpeptidase [Pseudomonas sp. GX19020]MCL4065026.1 L,D-transpeptidase [Pseudomonas sp. GX19020]
MRADFLPALALFLALAAAPLQAETQPGAATDSSASSPATAPGAKFIKPEIITAGPGTEDPVKQAGTLAEEILSAATLDTGEDTAQILDPPASAKGMSGAPMPGTLTSEPGTSETGTTWTGTVEPLVSEPFASSSLPQNPAIPVEIVLEAATSGVTRAAAIVEELRRETIEVRVSISRQMMEVRYNGEILHEWPVSTARKGKVTPKGSFKPQWLSKNHKSSLYNNAPMPYSIFYSGNYAIHGTDQESKLGRPASAGCVRLSRANAKVLFAMVQQEGKSKMKVEILD